MTVDEQRAGRDALAALAEEPLPLGAARPVDMIAPARAMGSLVLTSGQTAIRADGALVAAGVVGREVDLATARRCARRCTVNVLTAALTQLESLDDIVAVERVTVLVASTPDFTDQHLVADAVSECLRDVLGAERAVHTRTAMGVATLPTGSPVEVEGLFKVRAGDAQA